MKVYETYDEQETLAEAYGVHDAKGRQIGGLVHLGTLTLTEATPENTPPLRHVFDGEPGVSLFMRPHATRDGAPYGAIQRHQFFNTEPERAAAIAAYFRDARKRAAKRAGK